MLKEHSQKKKYPGSVEVLLNGGSWAPSWHDDLSVGRQNGQQSEGNHLDGVHLFSTTCTEQKKYCIQFFNNKRKTVKGQGNSHLRLAYLYYRVAVKFR